MNKIEFLSASLPYGLETMFDKTVVRLTFTNVYSAVNNNQVTPIIRHLDSLAQECVQADYNDGRPFIPIVEFYSLTSIDLELIDINEWGEELVRLIKTNSPFQLSQFQQLLKFHFWPNKPESEEVVYVSDSFNPYC